MKTLILIRHAKSDWGTPGQADRQRPLNMRGRHDASRMADVLLQRQWIPDLWLCSSAVRAEETTMRMAERMALPWSKIKALDELYLASSATLLEQIAITPDHINTLAMTAHNPGIAELASDLSRVPVSMPTCAVVAFQLHHSQWSALFDPANVQPAGYATPKHFG